METLKLLNLSLFLAAILFLFINNAQASSPPSLPVVIYGKVSYENEMPAEGINVVAYWTDEFGQERSAATKTLTSEEAEKEEAAGYNGYYFYKNSEITAPDGSKITLYVGSHSSQITAESGLLTEVPLILIPNPAYDGSEQYENGDISSKPGFFNFISNLFSRLFGSDNFKDIGLNNLNQNATNKLNNNSINYSSSKDSSDSSSYEINHSKNYTSAPIPSQQKTNSNPSNYKETYNLTTKTSENQTDINKTNDAININETRTKESLDNLSGSSLNYLQKGKDRTGLNTKVFVAIVVFLILIIAFYFLYIKKKKNRKGAKTFRNALEMMEAIKASQLANEDAPILGHNDSLLDAIELFNSSYSSFILVNSWSRIIGVITKKDIISKAKRISFDYLKNAKIKEFMQKDFIACDYKKNFKEVYKLLKRSKNGFLVVFKGSNFIGKIDYFDLLDTMIKLKIEIENPSIVGEFMRRKTNIVQSEMGLNELKENFLNKNEEYAIVQDGNSIKGIVTLKDFFSASYKYSDISKMKVISITSANLVSTTPGEYITSAAKLALERKFNQIPIKEGFGENITGVIKIEDIAKGYYGLLSEIKSELKKDILKEVE